MMRALSWVLIGLVHAAAAFAGPMQLLGTQSDQTPAGRGSQTAPVQASLEQLIANPFLITTPEQAKAVLDQLLKEAKTRPGTMADWNAILRACEVLSPQSGTRDIARFLRRKFYDDTLLDLAGFTPAKGEPNISPELARYSDKLAQLKPGWQEVQGPGGKLDFAHALVAIDAYSWQPNPMGRTKGWVFTYFGDWATGVASTFGAKGAGNNNEPDQRGNALGRTLVRTFATNESASLSALVSAAQAPAPEPETPPEMAQWLAI